MTHDQIIVQKVSVLLALAAVTAGAYFPWIRPNPNLAGETDEIPSILLPKMTAGIEGYSILLLIPVLAVLLLLVRGRNDRYQSLTIFVTGVFATSLPIYYIYTTSLAGFGLTFVPTYGWYMTIAGGVFLATMSLIQRS